MKVTWIIFFLCLCVILCYINIQTEIKIKCSDDVHHALKWSKKEPIIKEKGEDGTWNMNVYDNFNKSKNIAKDVKSKIPDFIPIVEETNSKMNSKKIKLCPSLLENRSIQSPLGLIWDQDD